MRGNRGKGREAGVGEWRRDEGELGMGRRVEPF